MAMADDSLAGQAKEFRRIAADVAKDRAAETGDPAHAETARKLAEPMDPEVVRDLHDLDTARSYARWAGWRWGF